MRIRWFKKRPQETLDVDEVIFDSFKEWEHRLEAPVSAGTAKLLLFLAAAVLAVFVARTVKISLLDGKTFSALAHQNAVQEIWERAERGIIYSSDSAPLVANVSSFNLVAIPAELPLEHESQEEIITFIQETFNRERNEVTELFKEINRFSSRPVLLVADINREEVLKFSATRQKLPGLRVEENFKRTYFEGEIFSHLTGYTGLVDAEDLKLLPDYLLTDLVGKSGVEFVYEPQLRGEYGKTEIERSSLGKENRTLASVAKKPGQNITLFINGELQKVATEAMRKTLNAAGLKRGAVAVVDPRSGGVLALQSFPLYDNNLFSSRSDNAGLERLLNDPARPLFNRAVSGLYPPGSTIKPFIAVAGLEEKVIDKNTTVNVTGSITVAGQEFRDWRPHGVVNLERAIAVSSNVFFYTVGGGYGDIEGLGPYRINDYLSRFGLGSVFKIDLPAEREGLVPDPAWKREVRKENWYIGDTYNISIGQGDMLVTPLGLAMGVAGIANYGTIVAPRVVKSIGNAPTSPEILYTNIASRESFELVREGMRETVRDGSARQLNSLPVAVAGKTGTAQSRLDEPPHAWFAAFAPYENPEIALVILIENGGEGSTIAVPVAKEILEWYFNR